jgi:translation elongation factor EF-G
MWGLGLMPTGFYRAIEETVHEVLKQGISGWQVIDCHVSLTQAGQHAPMTTAADFPAFDAAGAGPLHWPRRKPVVCEPISRFHLDLPASMVGTLVTALAQAGAVVTDTAIEDGMARLEGTIAARHGARHAAAIAGAHWRRWRHGMRVRSLCARQRSGQKPSALGSRSLQPQGLFDQSASPAGIDE